MQQGKVVDLDQEIAISSAKVSFQNKIPMADSIIYVTAQIDQAALWTQDNNFEKLEGDIRYYPK